MRIHLPPIKLEWFMRNNVKREMGQPGPALNHHFSPDLQNPSRQEPICSVLMLPLFKVVAIGGESQ